MVGYLKPDFSNTPKEYKKIYKMFYCGLCKALKSQYNYTGILSLNYELTAFLLLLSGLNENEQKHFHGSCSISPFVPVRYIDYLQSDLIKAAHLSVLIAYYEILDNTKDIGSAKWKVIEKYVSKKSKIAIDALDCGDFTKIEKAISNFYYIENDKTSSFNDLVENDGNLIQAFLSVLTKNTDENTAGKLLELSKLLGEWIYLIDACDDLHEDIINSSNNPLLLLDNLEEIDEIIKSIELGISKIIIELPIVNYSDLIGYLFIDNLRKTRNRICNKNK